MRPRYEQARQAEEELRYITGLKEKDPENFEKIWDYSLCLMCNLWECKNYKATKDCNEIEVDSAGYITYLRAM